MKYAFKCAETFFSLAFSMAFKRGLLKSWKFFAGNIRSHVYLCSFISFLQWKTTLAEIRYIWAPHCFKLVDLNYTRICTDFLSLMIELEFQNLH